MATRERKINFTIKEGNYLQLGYRPYGSGQPFVQVLPSPFYSQTPYSLFLDDSIIYEYELREICQSGCPEVVGNPIYINEVDDTL